MSENIQPIRVMDNDDALTWLRSQNGGTALSQKDLAARWGWKPPRVSRTLQRWQRAGLIERRGGRLVALMAEASPPIIAPVAPEPIPPKSVATRNTLLGAALLHRRAVGGAIAVAALGLAGFGLITNATYIANFGQPGLSAVMLAALGAAIEILALGLPSLAAFLAQTGDRRGARVAWVLWVPCVAMVLISACGFSSRYLTDSTLARQRVTDQAAGRQADLDDLKARRGAIHELRAVASIDAELAQAQAAAATVWRRSAGCTDVTRPDTAVACAPAQRLRRARADAVDRDRLDDEIRDLEGKLAAAPAIALADPAATVAADIVSWVSRGALSPAPHDVQVLRILILTMAPAWAGVLIGLALRLLDLRS